jgi:putative phosphoesterase
MKIGVISDTHGLLRPEAIRALTGCRLILHAGDVGHWEVLRDLRQIAPVVAVRGNVDTDDWAKFLPATEVAEVAVIKHPSLSFYILHRIADLDLHPEASGFAAVIYGHSHQPKIEWKNGVLYFNPGSAGPRRFASPVTVGVLQIVKGEVRPKIITLLK